MRTYSLVILTTLIATLFISGCKKDSNKEDDSYKCATCASVPEAAAAFNSSSKGIYKGLLIGSTGTIKFDIQNSGTNIKAYMKIDGTEVELTSSVSLVGGQPFIAPFTGTLNGQSVSITFSVEATGTNPMVLTANIPGHPNVYFAIAKETSNGLIECFEGTYQTSEPANGTFNILLSRTLGAWMGISRDNGSSETNDIDGTIVNGQIRDSDGNNLGTLSSDQVSGKFKDSDGVTTEFKGKRTL